MHQLLTEQDWATAAQVPVSETGNTRVAQIKAGRRGPYSRRPHSPTPCARRHQLATPHRAAPASPSSSASRRGWAAERPAGGSRRCIPGERCTRFAVRAVQNSMGLGNGSHEAALARRDVAQLEQHSAVPCCDSAVEAAAAVADPVAEARLEVCGMRSPLEQAWGSGAGLHSRRVGARILSWSRRMSDCRLAGTVSTAWPSAGSPSTASSSGSTAGASIRSWKGLDQKIRPLWRLSCVRDWGARVRVTGRGARGTGARRAGSGRVGRGIR